ncbi:unnamed protein product [Arctogadus glacialis]
MAEPVNLFTITSFFSETPERVKKGLNSFHSNRVVNVAVLPRGVIKGSVQASQKKKVYEVECDTGSAHMGGEKCVPHRRGVCLEEGEDTEHRPDSSKESV